MSTLQYRIYRYEDGRASFYEVARNKNGIKSTVLALF